MEGSEQIPTVANVDSGENGEGRQDELRKNTDTCSEGLSQEKQQALINCVGANDALSTSEKD